MLKSLHRKKLHSYFQSEPGSEPTDLQIDTFLQTYALAYAATELGMKLSISNWGDSEKFSKPKFKPLAQARTCTYRYIFEM